MKSVEYYNTKQCSAKEINADWWAFIVLKITSLWAAFLREITESYPCLLDDVTSFDGLHVKVLVSSDVSPLMLNPDKAIIPRTGQLAWDLAVGRRTSSKNYLNLCPTSNEQRRESEIHTWKGFFFFKQKRRMKRIQEALCTDMIQIIPS